MSNIGRALSNDGSLSLESVKEFARAMPSIGVTLVPVGFVISFFYNWGFLFALGASFDTVPLRITDFAISWVSWLPISIVMGFGLFASEFWSSRKRCVEGGEDEDEVSASPATERKLWRTTRAICLILVAIGLLFSLLYLFNMNVQPPFILGMGLSAFWSAFVIWVVNFPAQRKRYSKVKRDLILVIPSVAILVFFYGCSKVDPKHFGQHDVYTVYLMGEEEKASRAIEMQIIRTFEKWMVVRNKEGKIGWIRLDRVDRFDLEENVFSF